jgi:hypothetical protein
MSGASIRKQEQRFSQPFSTSPTSRSGENFMKALGTILRLVRQARGLGLEDVARHLGHRDQRKGVRRLMVIEATGQASDDMLVRLAEALDLDWADLEEVLVELRQRCNDRFHAEA